MPIYIYEAISENSKEAPELFEIQQSMQEKPLTKHPTNGKRIRRIITGGFGLMGMSSRNQSSKPSSGCHSGGCGCHG